MADETTTTSGPIQLEKAWHTLMLTMGYYRPGRVKSINSVTRHIRAQMRKR